MPTRLFQRLLGFLNRPNSRSVLLITFLTFASRGFGLLRQILIYQRMDKISSDLLNSAIKIPDQATSVLIMGTIVSSLLPVASRLETKAKEGDGTVSKYLSLILLFLVLSLLVLLSIVFIFTPQILNLSTSQDLLSLFREHNVLEDYYLTTRILLLGPILFALQATFNVFLYLKKDFGISAWAGLIYNMGAITGLFFMARNGYISTAWGMVAGSLATVLLYYWRAKKLGLQSFTTIFAGSRSFIRNLITNFQPLQADFWQTWKVFLPRMFIFDGLVTANIIIAFIAQREGQVTAVDIALSIYGSFLTIISSVGTVVFPDLAKAFNSKGDKTQFWDTLWKYIRGAFVLGLIITVLTFLATPVVTWVFEFTGRGQKNSSYINLIAEVASLGLVFHSLRSIVSNYFYVQESLMRPVVLSLLATLGQVWSIILFKPILEDSGVLAATSLIIYNFVWLFVAMFFIQKDTLKA